MTEERAAEAALETLTDEERRSTVIYVDATRLDPGSSVDVGRDELAVPWPAHLAFVDLAPTENWGHACRYVLVPADASGDEPIVVEAQFPPFLRGVSDNWRVALVGSSIPAWAVATDRRLDGEPA